MGSVAGDRIGTWAFVAMVALLLMLYVLALVGSPAPDVRTLAPSALIAPTILVEIEAEAIVEDEQ